MPLPEVGPAPEPLATQFREGLTHSQRVHLKLVADAAGELLVERIYPSRYQAQRFSTVEDAKQSIETSAEHFAVLARQTEGEERGLTVVHTDWEVRGGEAGGFFLRGLSPYLQGRQMPNEAYWRMLGSRATDQDQAVTLAKAAIGYARWIVNEKLPIRLRDVMPRQVLITPDERPVYIDTDPHLSRTVFSSEITNAYDPTLLLSGLRYWVSQIRRPEAKQLTEQAIELQNKCIDYATETGKPYGLRRKSK